MNFLLLQSNEIITIMHMIWTYMPVLVVIKIGIKS